MKNKIHKIKLDKPGELLACILNADVRTKKSKIISDQKYAIFAHELPSGNFGHFCALKQFFYLRVCVTNLSFIIYATHITLKPVPTLPR
jgi:hypothetical protein